MNAMKTKAQFAESFLLQLDMDIENAGLEGLKASQTSTYDQNRSSGVPAPEFMAPFESETSLPEGILPPFPNSTFESVMEGI